MESAAQPEKATGADVSGLLRAWSNGDHGALEKLTPIVYDELCRLAHRYMKGERAGHSLQTTALVNEAYMRLVDYKRIGTEPLLHLLKAIRNSLPVSGYTQVSSEHQRRQVRHISLEHPMNLLLSLLALRYRVLAMLHADLFARTMYQEALAEIGLNGLNHGGVVIEQLASHPDYLNALQMRFQ